MKRGDGERDSVVARLGNTFEEAQAVFVAIRAHCFVQ